jgi:hypothetical protein
MRLGLQLITKVGGKKRCKPNEPIEKIIKLNMLPLLKQTFVVFVGNQNK